jgi:hypothetical protein
MIITTLRAAAALTIIAVATTALAQLIPPSEMPGRERERFTDPQPPRSQYGGSIFSSPPPALYPPQSTKRSRHKARTPKR